ncbi:hypothetical protein SAMN05444409_1973 [Epilithonimonas zeae]|uniref:Uncharacterized protein n=3 Tax=Epilithonimonas zeae TaxID=1416779 RepID=A0A1N6GPM4_9FLAO|nr:hypothetical protein SAMN05444409_1973 [Epilithonimonas zeae]
MGLISTQTMISCRETAELAESSIQNQDKTSLYLRESDSADRKSTSTIDPDPPIKDTQDWKTDTRNN